MRNASVWSARLLNVLVALIALLGCRRDVVSLDPPDVVATSDTRIVAAHRSVSHHRMLDSLAEIARETPQENDYLGDREVRAWKQRLDSLPSSVSGGERLFTLVKLAEAKAVQGQEREVIQLLTTAYELLPGLSQQEQAEFGGELRYRLGLAHLRNGETQNCCARNTPDSCIMPIRGLGIHRDQQGSRQAIRYFEEVLDGPSAPETLRLKARWLLNLAHMTLGEYPDGVPEQHRIDASVFESDEDWPRFVNVAPRLELDTFNLCGGVIIDDFDSDGFVDIVTSTFDTLGQLHFFRNNGDGSFANATDAAGLTGLLGGLNLEQTDYNNDGHIDILVLRGAWLMNAGKHPNSLIRNNGDGTFTDVTFEAGLGEESYPTQTAAWADYDNDGDVDLFVGNEHIVGATVAPSQLFQNNGDGTFTDVARQAGVRNRRFAKGVTWGDYDNDGFADLFVSNMGEPNRLYRNQHDGTFEDVADEAGVTRPVHAFPTWFWDFNNDGALDLYVASNRGVSDSLASLAASYLGLPFEDELACLYKGDGEGGFTESAERHGLTRLDLPMGANFGDLDNDGFLDFYLGTGYPDYAALMPNVMYHNQAGARFADVTWNGGFGHLQKGHGIAFADIDNDGDQDIYAQMGGALRGDQFKDALFENPGFDNHWLSIKLVGVTSNRAGVGARIRLVVRDGDMERSIYRHVNSGGSFGANPLGQKIGVGHATTISRIEVDWPASSQTQSFTEIGVGQTLQITEGSGDLTVLQRTPFKLPAEGE